MVDTLAMLHCYRPISQGRHGNKQITSLCQQGDTYNSFYSGGRLRYKTPEEQDKT